MQRNQKSKVEPGYLMIAKIAEEKKMWSVFSLYFPGTYFYDHERLVFLSGDLFFRFPGSRMLLKILRYFFADREKKERKQNAQILKV